MVQIPTVPLQEETECQMVRVGRRRVALPEAELVDYDSHDLELSPGDEVKQVSIEPCGHLRVAQPPKRTPPVDDVLSMQDHWLIGAVWQVLLLEALQIPVESEIVGTAKPAAEKTQVPVAWLVELVEDVIARLVNVESVPLFRWQGWLSGCRWLASHEVASSTILISSSVRPYSS
jgi:hypothetical protein